MKFPDMSINGIVVTQETQVAALKLFLQNQSRQAKHLATFLEDLGVPVYNGFIRSGRLMVSDSVASRLLQRAKNEGIIKFQGGRWIDGYAAPAFLKGSIT